MATLQKSVKQALNPALQKQKPPVRHEIELFKAELIKLLDNMKDTKSKETEEHYKIDVMNFLNAVYYKDKHYINTKGKTDLVIHNDNNATSSVGVLIETKSPTNKAEMAHPENLNVKSFQELVLYYLRERKTGKNFELRYLIITNIYEWFVFDARTFEDTFAKDAKLVKLFDDFENKTSAATSTSTFYEEIAAPAIEKHLGKIEYAYFDIRDYDKILRNADKEDDKELIALYKYLSPVHLLKLPFDDESNRLNREFYAELLYILGLEEVKESGQKFIKRCAAGKREAGSFVENAIEALEMSDKLDNANLFDTALDLSISWINRVLFLKLLEAQIVKYNGNSRDFAFLSAEKIADYDELNLLFFQILAKGSEERNPRYAAKYTNVPYLNSALFEKTETEDKTIFVSALQNNIKMPLYPKSVLHGKNAPQAMKPLEYLLRFLDAYDFSGKSSEEIQEESKTLISASVLGLIFEKVNGYRDGSFFTPSSITMYMCREAISRVAIQKFNETKEWNCQTINDLYNKIEDIAEANEIFNSIRICDPSVGSGHFLVSALNEMIYLKSELGILSDKEGRRLRDYRVAIESDELTITDNENSHFVYNPKNVESQRVQETFFHEKQTIIENCLFGVDINPNSVKICQLRLWIELLKHTYYHTGTSKLETLPNIDINIKPGNSLISRFDLKDKYHNAPGLEQRVKEATKKYKEQVYLYKHATDDKAARRRITQNIDNEKAFFYRVNNAKDADFCKLEEVRNELALQTQGSFVAFQTEDWQQKTNELVKKVNDLESIYKQKIESCFEWRFEFPEVLDDDGNFVGFDIVIGNPPYIQLQSMGKMADAYKNMNYQVFERMGDIYCLFYELGYKLLKQKGYLSFITSNKWMRAGYGEKTRRFLVEQTNPALLLDFAGIKVFDEATVDVNILMYQKDKNRQQTQACIVKKEGIKELSVFVRQSSSVCSFSAGSWVVLSPIEQRIKAKIEAVGTPLKDWDIQIYRGILTGYNEAFIIDGKKKDELIAEDPKSEEIIRP
ncbi:MAG: Eco57I restriction-modification methylase domain-containing protein, partial [Prevotellaceae bacterium]|nr:Eco57I restriction-modification methylase domain-containing protein [Prevotellaceae bacterium]